METTIGIVDDHQLFVKSLALLLSSFPGFKVVVEATSGKDLQDKLKNIAPPDIQFVDVNMPVMNGIETAAWMSKAYPATKLVALSMNDNERSIIAMIRSGCCAYLLKDMHPNDLEKALVKIAASDFYNVDANNINYRRLMMAAREEEKLHFTDREREFLQLACSDHPYRDIAKQMNLSERTIDGYRETLFHKLNVQNRIGLVLEAIKRELVKL
jgi:DNA-binding NarL/FixJ family response regulator